MGSGFSGEQEEQFSIERVSTEIKKESPYRKTTKINKEEIQFKRRTIKYKSRKKEGAQVDLQKAIANEAVKLQQGLKDKKKRLSVRPKNTSSVETATKHGRASTKVQQYLTRVKYQNICRQRELQAVTKIQAMYKGQVARKAYKFTENDRGERDTVNGKRLCKIFGNYYPALLPTLARKSSI